MEYAVRVFGHADRFIDASSDDDSLFKPVGDSLCKDGPYISVNPHRANFQHCLADRDKGRKLVLCKFDHSSPCGQLFSNIVTQLLPGRKMLPVLRRNKNLRQNTGVLEVDCRQKRVCFGDVLEYRIYDGCWKCFINQSQCLLWIT